MSYAELLSQYIEQSELSLGEIAIRLKAKDIKVDRSYISKLKNGTKPPASDDISRALAEVTGGNPDELILTGYLERAPLEVQKIVSDNKVFNEFLDELLKAYLELPVLEELLQDPEEKVQDKKYEIREDGRYYRTDDFIKKAIEAASTETKLNFFNLFSDNGNRLYKKKVLKDGQILDDLSIEFEEAKFSKINIGSDSQVLIHNGTVDILTDEESEFLKDNLDSFRKQKEKWENKYEIK